MKFGIVRFPGSNCDEDAYKVVSNLLGEEAVYLWHEETSLQKSDCIILPGGFSYGDYLRAGAMAKLSPIVESIKKFAASGGLVLGICNGFQVLTEIGLLPGALTRNIHQQFICAWQNLRVENAKTPFTSLYKPDEEIRIPIANGEGRYSIDPKGLKSLEQNNQIVFRYVNNPNGSVSDIAGICNREGNVLGLMPHPERASEALLGGTDGLKLFKSIQKGRFLQGIRN